MTEKKEKYDPQLVAEIRQQVLTELKDEENRKKEEERIQREKERKAHEEYIAKMKSSKDPWVDIRGINQDDRGIKIELDWNDAFVKYLREHGYTGANDEAIVHRYVAEVSYRIAEDMRVDESFE